MIEKIRKLEKLAAPLDPTPEQRKKLLSRVLHYTEPYIDTAAELPGYIVDAKEGIGLYDSPISDESIGIEKALELLRENVDRPGVNPGSAGYLAYTPGSGLYVSALADYIAAITNRYAGVYFASPGAVRMERMLMRWIADFVGYPETAAGDLTSGGSIANLTGIVTAREALGLKARDVEKSVVYISQQTHHSVMKALKIAGVSDAVLRVIPLDDQFRMKTEILESSIIDDLKNGLNPWLIVAAAGTTDTGAVDPLVAIAAIAEEYKLWLHVDGAYGAAFALCDLGKRKLQGLELSDSLVLDPHKGLFVPFGSGSVLVKEGGFLRNALRCGGTYLQDQEHLASDDEISPADLSPELTRHFRALRLWLPLKLAGVAPFRAALEEKLLLSRYFYERMTGENGFEMGPPPDLSIVTYRYMPKRGDIDEFNRKLIHEVQRDGRVFLSSTTIDGRFTLRMAILGFRSHLDIVDLAIEILKEKAAQLSAT